MTEGQPFSRDAARYAAIVEHSSDIIVSKTLDGMVETWNASAERVLGWRANEIVGKSIREIVPAERQAEEDSILDRIRNGEFIPKFETVRIAKGGAKVDLAITISPMRDQNGHVIGASKIAHDLTEELQARAELKRQAEQFTALAENIPQLAWLADPQGSIYWYNKRWFDYTGTDLEGMQGWGWTSVHHPDHVDRVVERIQQSWASGEPWEDTFPLRGADGGYRWFLSRANPLRDSDGKVVLWCGTNTDITEHREFNERIKLLMREVNHRSRNMLAVMQAMISRSVKDTSEELIHTLTHRIRALASNQEILNGGDWSGARVQDVVKAQIHHVVSRDSQQVELDGPEDLILAAPQAEALGLAVHELATNAAKYGALAIPAGRISFRWRLEKGATGSVRLCVEWVEMDGPPVIEPTRKGFGTLLITRNAEQVFGGDVTLQYAAEGLRWRLDAPAEGTVIDEVRAQEILQW